VVVYSASMGYFYSENAKIFRRVWSWFDHYDGIVQFLLNPNHDQVDLFLVVLLPPVEVDMRFHPWTDSVDMNKRYDTRFAADSLLWALGQYDYVKRIVVEDWSENIANLIASELRLPSGTKVTQTGAFSHIRHWAIAGQILNQYSLLHKHEYETVAIMDAEYYLTRPVALSPTHISFPDCGRHQGLNFEFVMGSQKDILQLTGLYQQVNSGAFLPASLDPWDLLQKFLRDRLHVEWNRHPVSGHMCNLIQNHYCRADNVNDYDTDTCLPNKWLRDKNANRLNCRLGNSV